VRHRRTGRRRVRAALVVCAALATVLIVDRLVVAAQQPATAQQVTPPPPAASGQAPAGLVLTDRDYPDPFVLTGAKRDYLYTAGYGVGQTPHVPVMAFTDLARPGPLHDAMPVVPRWSTGWIWNQAVAPIPHGYVMWFTATSTVQMDPNGAPSKCIGTAFAHSPLGPFVAGPSPVICQTWGSIDPFIFHGRNGHDWLIWKADTNADRTQVIPTTIWAQQLTAHDTRLVGHPLTIAVADQPWEGALIESPDLVQSGSQFYLFFSGGSSDAAVAGIGADKCAGPAGPCQPYRATPLLASNAQGPGPDEESLFTQHGDTWLLYSPNAIFGPYESRPLAVARVAFGPQGPELVKFDGAVPGPG
jgi:hypothetical protein